MTTLTSYYTQDDSDAELRELMYIQRSFLHHSPH